MSSSAHTDWYCVNCGHVIGHVIGKELTPADDVPSNNVRTRGVDLSVQCPECDRVKIWYTSDAINRAINQLIDAVTTAFVHRLVPKLGDLTSKSRAGDGN